MAEAGSVPATGAVLHRRTERCDAQLLDRCAEVTGERAQPPLGIAFVLALRTLMGSEALPDGAIMVGHRVTWSEPPPRDEEVATELVVAETGPPGRRFRAVTLRYSTHGSDGRLLIVQDQEVLWPTN